MVLQRISAPVNELRRMQYLEAIGVDCYMSRSQLPGAAPSKRLALVRRNTPSPAIPVSPVGQPTRQQKAPGMPKLEASPPRGPAAVSSPGGTRDAASYSGAEADAVQFSLAVMFAGGIAWIEELDDRPLARDQVQLVHGMARALQGQVDAPEVAQFDWPLHSNRQLGLGAEAALAGVSGFLQRQIELRQCRGMVLLGEAVCQRVPSDLVPAPACVRTESTLAMLHSPGLKAQVWRDLQPLAQ